MPAQDTSQLKEKILSILRIRGPSLPVHIAKETGLSMLFASAFLSELFSEQKIKISSMKIGSSPIYFLPEQKPKLENFAHHLKSKEKEAFLLLKEKGFLKDETQLPAIRVALRAIKDFAIPFKKNDEFFWRYFLKNETEFNHEEKQEPKEETEKIPEAEQKEEKIIQEQEIIKEIPKQETIKEKTLNIFDSPKKKKKQKKKTSSKKEDEKLFNKIKDFLSKENIEIINFQVFSKNEIVLKIKENDAEKILIAYNKRRITDSDLIKTYKKIEEKTLPYILLSFGEPPKKIISLIETFRNLERVEKIDKESPSKTF